MSGGHLYAFAAANHEALIPPPLEGEGDRSASYLRNGGGVALPSLAQSPLVADPSTILQESAKRSPSPQSGGGIVNLGLNIGSATWWRGMATLVGLIVVSLGLTTIHTPNTAAPDLAMPLPAPLDTNQRSYLASAAIGPLMQGAHTGWHMPMTALASLLSEFPEKPRVELTLDVRNGDSLAGLLKRAGAGAADIKAAFAKLKDISLYPDSEVDLVLGRRETKKVPRPLESLAYRARFDLKMALERKGEDFQTVATPVAIRDAPRLVRVPVGHSLYVAAHRMGVPARVVSELSTAMSYSVDFQRDVVAKDTLDLVFERQISADGLTEDGTLQYAVLNLESRDKPVELLRYASDSGKVEFFYPDGTSVKGMLMKTPVDGAHLTSGFGMRWHPILGYSRMHQGVDFGAPTGTPVMAAGSGTITFMGRHGGHGNTVMISHQNGLETLYGHLSAFVRGFHVGSHVTQGQVVALVGSTGLSTGPHLHYEIHRGSKPVNPQDKNLPTGRHLSGSQLAEFKALVNKMRGVKPDRHTEYATKYDDGAPSGGGI